MNVREALDKIAGESLCHSCGDQRCHACTAYMVRHEMAEELAPNFERALRASAERMGDILIAEETTTDTPIAIEEVFDECVTAGVTAMIEEAA